jgi:hypothetical protein
MQTSRGFRFGNSITLRHIDQSAAGPAFRFQTSPVRRELGRHGDTATYHFAELKKLHGVPYVTIAMDITTNDTGVTATTRRSEPQLTEATTHWPAADPDIVQLARKITAGAGDTKAKVGAILAWLAPGKHIRSGGPVRGSRWGVKRVLQQRFGHCWDFSDCFVTLCRAVEIPCRQVGGWILGTSGHIWAEVLVDGEGWLQVDPTGGGQIDCGIYYIPYFTTEDGEMPILYVDMPTIEALASASASAVSASSPRLADADHLEFRSSGDGAKSLSENRCRLGRADLPGRFLDRL